MTDVYRVNSRPHGRCAVCMRTLKPIRKEGGIYTAPRHKKTTAPTSAQDPGWCRGSGTMVIGLASTIHQKEPYVR